MGHTSRDATAIAARKKPAPKEKKPARPKRKRGHPRKGRNARKNRVDWRVSVRCTWRRCWRHCRSHSRWASSAMRRTIRTRGRGIRCAWMWPTGAFRSVASCRLRPWRTVWRPSCACAWSQEGGVPPDVRGAYAHGRPTAAPFALNTAVFLPSLHATGSCQAGAWDRCVRITGVVTGIGHGETTLVMDGLYFWGRRRRGIDPSYNPGQLRRCMPLGSLLLSIVLCSFARGLALNT